ncbi:PREDICTED: coiled-coil domain-containing protein R3HCC1L [Tarenaya hassleriana]|uniref:coiled-coil domain-containing protein R3HCC1L n=1 Tax=Tarenaya hassleriana TaxID=28532 RepID=UPI00053C9FB0|nr:PREDICTED: coiled-coil domain-containing protein R3HCC1L [Tarenaya hassleriana]
MANNRANREKEEVKASIDEQNWSERVEDLVSAGDIASAISFLESLVADLQSRLGSSSENFLQLASALSELADLYSSQGLSLKSDELRVRSSLVKQSALACEPVSSSGDSGAVVSQSSRTAGNGVTAQSSSDDDWEAIADSEPSKLLSLEELPDVSKLSVEEPKVQEPKRRGRGTFTYKRDEMYSERDYSEARLQDSEDRDISHGSEKTLESLKSKYGTRHVLVLSGFSPNLRTIDLEKLFVDFKDSGVVIRWINDTTALAVFKTPSTAQEACNRVQCSFTVRVLNDDDDALLGSISARDLEPPAQRPKTSARTAQRLIAHSMGLKLPNTGFGSKELRDQEAARRNRIVARQKQRDDAWGDDD